MLRSKYVLVLICSCPFYTLCKGVKRASILGGVFFYPESVLTNPVRLVEQIRSFLTGL